MRKPNYGQERAERERAKDAKARAKAERKQADRMTELGQGADGEARPEGETEARPPAAEPA